MLFKKFKELLLIFVFSHNIKCLRELDYVKGLHLILGLLVLCKSYNLLLQSIGKLHRKLESVNCIGRKHLKVLSNKLV